MDTHLTEEGLFIERGEEKWREGRGGKNVAGRPRREECGGKKWRESTAGGEMAGERDLSAYGKLIGTYQLSLRR